METADERRRLNSEDRDEVTVHDMLSNPSANETLAAFNVN